MRSRDVEKGSFDYLLASSITVLTGSKNLTYERNLLQYAYEIEEVWAKEQDRRDKSLFNGRMLNLVHISVREENGLALFCHTVEYMHFVAQRVGKIPLDITPLAVSGIVLCKSENGRKSLLMGKRSESVTQYPGYFELIPSGSIDVSNLSPVDQEEVDYKKQLLIELEEELGIESSDITTCTGFSLIFDACNRVYDIGLEIEIKNDVKLTTDKSEYSSLDKVPIDSFDEYTADKNVVPTSLLLYPAWQEFRLGGE